MLINSPLRLITAKVPPAPFAGCQYKTTLTTTTDETITVWTGIDIGVPHPNRIIVIVVCAGISAALNQATNFNGYDIIEKVRQAEWSIATFKVPTGTTGRLSLSITGSLRKAVSVFVTYAKTAIMTFNGTATAAGTTDATVSNIRVVNKGCLIYGGGQLSTLGTFTTTWGGSDTLVEDVDAQLEATSSYTAGHVNINRSTANTSLTLAESTSGTKRLVVCAFYPPIYY